MSYPGNIISLIVFMSVVSGILYSALALAALNRVNPARKSAWRVGIIVFLGGTFALALTFALTQRYTLDTIHSSLYTALAINIIVVTNIVLLLVSRTYRQMVDSTPLHWLIGSHLLRAIPGIAFLALFDMGLLPRDNALQAGYGDILSGVLAVLVAYLVVTGNRYAWPVLLAWNIFGLLDLVNALYTGLTTIPPWLQLIGSKGQSVEFINLFLMLPTFMVPLFMVNHIWLFRRLIGLRSKIAESAEKRIPAY